MTIFQTIAYIVCALVFGYLLMGFFFDHYCMKNPTLDYTKASPTQKKLIRMVWVLLWLPFLLGAASVRADVKKRSLPKLRSTSTIGRTSGWLTMLSGIRIGTEGII